MQSILADKRVLVYDRGGLFPHVAERLADYCQDYPVGYFSQWREDFSRSQKRLPGQGLAGIERVDSFFDAIDSADLIVFPDIGDGDLQDYLRSHGHLVFGSGPADQIELDKVGFYTWLAASELPCPETWHIQGLEALKSFLEDPANDDIWLKSNDRGDFETYHHINWKLSQQWYNELYYHIGPNGENIQIIASEKIDATDEIGYDGYMIDGQFPVNGIYGFEAKDSFYIGKFTNTFPASINLVNRVMGERVATMGYRGLWSTEIRETKDGVPYFIDPTCRAGSPPSECMMKWYKNWDEIMYYGAAGRLVEPDASFIWGAEIILRSSVQDHFLPLDFPEYLRPLLALHYHCIIDGCDYITPRSIPEIGAALGYGRTPQEAGEQALEIAKQLKGDGIEFNEHSYSELIETVLEYEENFSQVVE